MSQQFAVQHVRFFRPTTTPIHCMVYDAFSNKLAISRSDGLLEIYRHSSSGVRLIFDFSLPPFLVGEDSPTSIEAMTWYNGRLFSAGLNGLVVEYDLERLAIARSQSLDASSIWALATVTSSQTGGGLLACGCDSGNIYLVNLLTAECSTPEDTLELSGPPLLHGAGRVLSLAWVSNDKYLVSGGMESIFVWKIAGSRRGQIAWQMNLPKKAIVWSLVAYPAQEPIFASSDSRGMVSIWNAKHGTLISELSTHHLDVLTMTVGSVGSSPVIFASGADPTVVSVMPFSPDNLANVDSWMTTEIHKDHEHDVRASCFIAPDLLLTAGVDRNVVVSRINSASNNRRFAERATFLFRMMPVFNWANFVSVERISSSQSVLAISQPSDDGNHSVEIWQLLATPQDYEIDEESSKEEKLEPNRQLVVKMPCHFPPQVVKLSPLANFVAFAAGPVLRVFKLDILAPSASKHFTINFEPTKRKFPAPSVTAIAFCNETSKTPILGLAADGQLAIRSSWHPEMAKTFHLGDDFKSEDSNSLPTLFLRVSNDEEDSFTVAVGSRNLIRLYKISIEEEFSLETLCRLPTYTNGLVTAMSLYPDAMVLIAFSDRRVAEFDGTAQRYTKWTRQTLVGASRKSLKSSAKKQKLEEKVEESDVANVYPQIWLQLSETIDWVGYCSSSRTKILTASSRLLATIDKTAPLPMRVEGPLFKGPFQHHKRPGSPMAQLAIQHVSRFRYILSFDCLKPLDNTNSQDEGEPLPGELFVAELPSGEFRAQLPPTIVCKKQFAA